MSEEMERCKNDPVYFLNTYHNGFEKHKITQEEYERGIRIMNDQTGTITQRFNDWWHNRRRNTLKE